MFGQVLRKVEKFGRKDGEPLKQVAIADCGEVSEQWWDDGPAAAEAEAAPKGGAAEALASAALAIDRAPAWCSGISGHHQKPRNERTNTEVRAAGGAGGEAASDSEAGRKSSLKHRAAEHGVSRSLPVALASQVPHSLRAHGTSLG